MQPSALDYTKYPVLVVDDERDNLDIFRFNFRRSHTLLFAESGAEALEVLRTQPVSVVVTDQRMPGMTGLELLHHAREVRPETVNILVTGYADVLTLGEAINNGLLYRFLSKPWSSEDVSLALRGAIERHHLQQENKRLVAQIQQVNAYLADEAHATFNFGGIVGKSEPLRRVLEHVEQVAPTDASVFIQGETGTGKELIARAIHLGSARAEGPFVKVNCAALSPSVLESELFGHEKGAFTGAMQRRVGRFELADGGTLFLDEVGDLPLDTQIKLLRVIQERELERVGGNETVKVDIRLVTATHRDLDALVTEGKFREDLYYRLNVFPLRMPPLRERADDVEELAEHFARRFAAKLGRRFSAIDPEAMAKLRAYAWPGNVRELENTLERAMILCTDGTVRTEQLQLRSLPGPSRSVTPSPPAPASAAPTTGTLSEQLDDLERARLATALEKHRGRKSDVARELGINRSTLYYRLKKFGFE
jgi:two-component system response regulator AtoC